MGNNRSTYNNTDSLFNPHDIETSHYQTWEQQTRQTQHHHQEQQYNYNVQMTIPDELIPALIGKNRSNQAELQAKSGAKIVFSDRNDFVPGTNNRRIEIMAESMQSCATAQYLISQIIRSQVSGGDGGGGGYNTMNTSNEYHHQQQHQQQNRNRSRYNHNTSSGGLKNSRR